MVKLIKWGIFSEAFVSFNFKFKERMKGKKGKSTPLPFEIFENKNSERKALQKYNPNGLYKMDQG